MGTWKVHRRALGGRLALGAKVKDARARTARRAERGTKRASPRAAPSQRSAAPQPHANKTLVTNLLPCGRQRERGSSCRVLHARSLFAAFSNHVRRMTPSDGLLYERKLIGPFLVLNGLYKSERPAGAYERNVLR